MIKEAFLTFFIPLLYLLAVLIIYQTGKTLGFGIVWAIFGLFFTAFGLFLWASSFIALGRQVFTVLPKAKLLRTGGAYKFFRHPLYLGISLTFLGLSLSTGSKIGLLYTIFLIIPLNILRAKKEEKVLVKKFGLEYLDYKKRTII